MGKPGLHFAAVAAVLLLAAARISSSFELEPWSYACDQYNRCVKQGLESEVPAAQLLGLQECLLKCQPYALFWPRPRSLVTGDERRTVELDVGSIRWTNAASYSSSPEGTLLQRNVDEQVQWLEAKRPSSVAEPGPSNNRLDIVINIAGGSGRKPKASRAMVESHVLNVTYDNLDSAVVATVTADDYFGARHAIESLFQAVDYDDVRRTYVMLTDFYVEDEPAFTHRGISMDTSRNFVTVDVLKRIIDGLAASKMNVFHWHIVDSHSFPVELTGEKTKLMAQYGAYDAASIYSQQEIRDLVEYANYRGVRVIPELDQPAHVGFGWNFPGAENYTVCLAQEPWFDYCLEPPCGQLNPAEPAIYDHLEALYEEFHDLFQSDTFHMGADEVFFPCWNSSDAIREYMGAKGMDTSSVEGFIELWKEFQDESSARLKAAAGQDVKIVVWTSDLTNKENIDNLPPEDYIIQIWTNGSDTSDQTIGGLVEGGYRMIFSNYEATYMDCGYGAWVGEGNNWCSPYKGWQLFYGNDMLKLLEIRGFDTSDPAVRDLVLGAESAMWTEQADTESVEGKIFPRTAALGERLWSNPEESWYDAETRMLEQRRRLVQRGIKADRLQPEWCRQNSGQCYGTENNPLASDGPDSSTEDSPPNLEDDGGAASLTAAASVAAAALALAAALR